MKLLLKSICSILVLTFALPLYAEKISVSDKDMVIVLVSDINGPYGSTSYDKEVHVALDYIIETRPDLVICAGDMIAGQKKGLSLDQLNAMWNSFNHTVLKRLTVEKIPFAFTLGNHDGSGSRTFAHERNIARRFWKRNPINVKFVDNSQYPDYYSFVANDIFLVCIDAAKANIHKTQRNWLENQLLSKVSQNCKFRVVIGHLPLYAIAQGRNKPGDVLSDAEALNSLFARTQVDCYISGHHHAFFYSEKKGVKMIFAGALGSGPRKYIGCDAKPVKTFSKLLFDRKNKKIRAVTFAPAKGMQNIISSDLPAYIKNFYNRLERIEDQLLR